MSELNKTKSEIMKKDDNFIYSQTNPSFHDTLEDSKNYKSLQNLSQSTLKSSIFTLKPSILTEKAEKLRTDKEAVKSISINNSGVNKFLVFGNEKSREKTDKNLFENTKNVEKTSGDFIFGEKIFERVVTNDKNDEKDKNKKEFKDLTSEDVQKIENTEICNVDGEKLRKNAEEIINKNTPQHLEEVEKITGEEDEKSVLKLSCKIFLYSNDQHEWVEKGFSFVHVNDSIDKLKGSKSRLVARSKGGLKVIINTFIWADMVLERANDKSLRITSQGEDGVKSYLLRMLNNNDADMLYHQLFVRKSALTTKTVEKNNRKRDLNSSNEDCCESKKGIFSDDE